MPFHILLLSRRQFLAGGLAVGAGLRLGTSSFAAADPMTAKPVDPNFWALLSDTHIWEKRTEKYRETLMADNLEKVREEVLALDKRPGAVLINGDCALKDGQKGDYEVFSGLIKPFTTAEIPLHLTLGNHDQRERFWDVLKNGPGEEKRVENKHVAFVAGEKANWFLLDSLDKTNETPGLLGERQLKWLAGALDQNANKPAIVATHHHPQGTLITTRGLTDTQALLDVILPRKHVKVLFFGHTHHWLVTEIEGLHCVNLPPVAYLFNPSDPNGWVKFNLENDRGTVELVALDKKHTAHGDKHELKWRG